MNNCLVGRYKLLSHGTYDPDLAFLPTSDHTEGELQYSSEGYLSVLIKFKPIITSNRDILAYSGKYEIISPNEIIHKINICSRTERNASSENRIYKLMGDLLILTVILEKNTTFEAKWMRILE